MNDSDKTKAQLAQELAEARQQIAALKIAADRRVAATDDSQQTNRQLREELAALRTRVLTLEHSEEAEREQRTLAEALAETTATLNSTLDLDEVLKHILNQIGRVMPHDTANILLIDEESQGLRFTSGPSYSDFDVETSKGVRVSLPDTPTLRQMAETLQSVVITDTQTDPRWITFPDTQSSYVVRSYVGAPICHKGNLIGFINCNSTKPEFYTAVHAEQLRAFANQAAVAIENARLYDLAQKEIDERKRAEKQRLELALERERVQILANFITKASHEFRTPLSVINTSTHLIQQLTTPEEQKRHFHKIEDQINSITTLITNMTVLSTLDSTHHLALHEVNVNDVIRMVHNTLQAQFPKQQRTIDLELTESPLVVPGDSKTLYHAIECLWHNAIRFLPDGGTITVRSSRDDGRAVIEIADDGPGISEDDIPRIFERFFRADMANTTRGFGLGLAIARRSVELHGGTIEVSSHLGDGSTFRVLLPLS